MKRFVPALGLLAAIAFAPAPAHAQLLVNGGFDNGSPDPWATTGSAIIYTNEAVYAQSGPGYADVAAPVASPTGTTTTGTVSQTIATTVGHTYLIQYYAANWDGYAGDALTAQFGASTTPVAANIGPSMLSEPNSDFQAAYVLNTFTEVATSTSTTLTFFGTAGIVSGSQDWVSVDSVSVSDEAPELNVEGCRVPVAAVIIGCLIFLP